MTLNAHGAIVCPIVCPIVCLIVRLIMCLIVRRARSPRAKIFRRDAAKIESRHALRRFMRYNEWQTDPFSVAGYGGPDEGPSAENAIAARGDLIRDSPSSTQKRAPFGNTDAKLVDETDVRMMR